MLSPIEILTRKLTHARRDAFIQPALLDPPGIQAARIFAGHPTRAGEETQIRSQIASTLPERGRMEIQSLHSGQRAKIDVHRPAKSVPTGKSLFLFALDVPEGITDVLKIESHAAFQQARPFAAPVPEKVAVWTLTGFVTVRAGKRFLLRAGGKGEHTETAP